jgi:hypothetical protein
LAPHVPPPGIFVDIGRLVVEVGGLVVVVVVVVVVVCGLLGVEAGR